MAMDLHRSPDQQQGIVTARRKVEGFTLLELLVALALAAVISLCITTVGQQAQEIYDATTSKVEVYQKFRYALHDMQETLDGMTVTSDLEFFVDRAAGVRDPGKAPVLFGGWR